METNVGNDFINSFNQRLSNAYAEFSLALEDVENITPEDEKYLIREKIQEIDRLYQSALGAMRPHLKNYAENMIQKKLSPGAKVYYIYRHYDCAGAYFAGWSVKPYLYVIDRVNVEDNGYCSKTTYHISPWDFLGETHTAVEKDLFFSLEEAAAECNRRNIQEQNNV